MVDSLAASDLVRRHGTAGRAVPVRLTAHGSDSAGRLLTALGEPLADLLRDLDDADRGMLARPLESLLGKLYARAGGTELVCRLCDRTACTATATCPVGEAARNADAEAEPGR